MNSSSSPLNLAPAASRPFLLQPTPDVEEQADEFEETLAAELIRRGVIERW